MQADFSLDYDVLTVAQSQKLYLMARFVADPAPEDNQRRPLNISLVIDRSGSMAGDKISYTKQASQFLVQNLQAKDLISIVLYNDKIETLLPPENVTNKDVLTQRIEQIRVGGTTNLSGGWLEGCKHVASHLGEDFLNRVILMSDGLANRGVTDPVKLVAMAKQKYEEGISTTTMGLGNDFNEDLMMAIAEAGGGAFYFIESPEVAPLIFNEELRGLLNVVGQNLMITLLPNEHVASVNQLNAYPMQTDGKKYEFRLGDIFGEEEKVLVLELSIPALETMGEQQIATLLFAYDELLPDGGTKHRTWEMPVMVNVQATSDQPLLPNPEVTGKVLLLQAAQVRQDAVKAADRGEYDTASTILRDVAKKIKDADLDIEQLNEEYTALIEQADQLEKGDAGYNDYSRKSMTSQAFYSMHNRHEDTVMLRSREHERQQKKPTKKPNVDNQTPKTPTQVKWDDTVFALDKTLMRIGRAEHNEIPIPRRGISRFHCQIMRDGDNLLLEDIGSKNGSYINGERLTTPHVLNVDDELVIGEETLIFLDSTSAL